MDISMLQTAGKERSKREFIELLESEGCRVVKIWGKGNVVNSII